MLHIFEERCEESIFKFSEHPKSVSISAVNSFLFKKSIKKLHFKLFFKQSSIFILTQSHQSRIKIIMTRNAVTVSFVFVCRAIPDCLCITVCNSFYCEIAKNLRWMHILSLCDPGAVFCVNARNARENNEIDRLNWWPTLHADLFMEFKQSIPTFSSSDISHLHRMRPLMWCGAFHIKL